MGSAILGIVAGLPGLIIAMVVHEYAHARVAVAQGDFTPRLMGRLTLNPMAHIDPLGFVALLLVRFGWAKPVIVNPANFKHGRRSDIMVSLAGPGANLLTAFVALFFVQIYWRMGFPVSEGMREVFLLIVFYNINFAVFNLLPLPPLDGAKVVEKLLPPRMAYQFLMLERYSLLIMIILMVTPVLRYVLIPCSQFIYSVFSILIGIIV